MTGQTKTRNQHYVQQALLRNWSLDKTKKKKDMEINCIEFNNDRSIASLPRSRLITDVFNADYLYGKSSKYEDELFGSGIEKDFQNWVKKIRSSKFLHDRRIQEYILYQICRTKYIIDICNHNEEVLHNRCFDSLKDEARKAGVSKDDVKSFHEDKYGQNKGYVGALDDIILPSVKSFTDLLKKQKLIISDIDLFIGDNPVIIIRPFGNSSSNLFSDLCAMILLPISPNEIVALYLPEGCEVKDDYKFNNNEAHCFNSFQIQQSYKFIAYYKNFDECEYEPYLKDTMVHKTMMCDGFQFPLLQELHYSGLDSCFRNILK